MMAAEQRSRSERAGVQFFGNLALTVALAAITHAYEFGAVAFVVGAGLVGLLWWLMSRARRTGEIAVLFLYGVLSLWIVVGLGLVGGLWNHAVKAVAVTLHAGRLPPGMEQMFMSPELGSAVAEVAGVLSGVSAIMAAHQGYRYARAVIAIRSTAARS